MRKSVFYLKLPKKYDAIAWDDENVNNEYLDIYKVSVL
jgi:hypothetical protein